MANLSAIIAPTNLVTATSTTTLSNKTLVAPALGTPASGNLSNCTGIPSPSAATPTALGTVYGKQTTVGGTPFLTAYGYNAGGSTTGVRVTAVGVDALYTNSTGARNTALGNQAGYSNTGDNNLFIGVQAGFTNTTGTGNSFVGGMDSNNWPPGYYNTTGSSNSAFGGGALRANTTGSNNTAIGTDALHLNTTASQNTAVGYESAYSTTTGASNAAFGAYSLRENTTGLQNTATGISALYNNTTGSSNVASGWQSLFNNSTAANNTAVGYQAGHATTTGYNNTCLGYQAGLPLTTGIGNTFIGILTGRVCTTGSTNIHLGYNTLTSSSSVGNEIVISTNSDTGKGGSTGFISPNGGGVYQGNNSATWSITSDQRLKKNIVDNDIGLNAINAIRVRNFEYRLPEEITDLPQNQAIKKQGIQLGAIAQELQTILPDCVKTESTGVMSVNSDNLTWYLINAVKELSARVKQLEGN